jgi:hypothetical protein
LVLADRKAHRSLRGDAPAAIGLPIVGLPQGKAFSRSASPRLDVETNVTLYCYGGFAEIGIGNARAFNSRAEHGRVQFLISDGVLVGLRILDLTETEQSILCDYIAENPGRTE